MAELGRCAGITASLQAELVFLFGCLSVFTQIVRLFLPPAFVTRIICSAKTSQTTCRLPLSKGKLSTPRTTFHPDPGRIILFKFNVNRRTFQSATFSGRFAAWEVAAHLGRSINLRSGDVLVLAISMALPIGWKGILFQSFGSAVVDRDGVLV